ncbi:IPExxxVDY family protein [Maribacter halichondriae]|uniref:IPExxxVDY family protein n=1 Tax=Maribacter halichondriae TaxID=2980554 RepID=UPI002359FF4C|nr:IPExxxVDY family protein [Maribacter sp. Hal144]
MAAIHRITEDLYEDSFAIIAVHSSLEDHALVYALNQNLKTKFKRCSKDLELSPFTTFPIFEWNDTINDSYWTLITNGSIKKLHIAGEDLFVDEPSFSKHYVLPEYKEVDYLLKIEQDELDHIHKIVKKLLEMPKVLTAYRIDTEKLKSKNHLIF